MKKGIEKKIIQGLIRDKVYHTSSRRCLPKLIWDEHKFDR